MTFHEKRRILVDGIDEHIGIEDQHSRFVQHLIERLAVGDIDPEASASPGRKRGQGLRGPSDWLPHCQSEPEHTVCKVRDCGLPPFGLLSKA